MKAKIKICGLRSEEDIRVINEVRPDYAGFILFPGSRRYVSDGQLEHLAGLLYPGILPVGVFVGEAPERVARLLNEGKIGAAQLHGKEDEKYLEHLRSLTGKQIWKAFRIDTAGDARRAMRFPADVLLLDHGAGGTGESFDWNVLRGVQEEYFLAGGLNCDNIREALRMLCPAGVDVSSGVETDGKKDPEKIREFVRIVRELK